MKNILILIFLIVFASSCSNQHSDLYNRYMKRLSDTSRTVESDYAELKYSITKDQNPSIGYYDIDSIGSGFCSPYCIRSANKVIEFCAHINEPVFMDIVCQREVIRSGEFEGRYWHLNDDGSFSYQDKGQSPSSVGYRSAKGALTGSSSTSIYDPSTGPMYGDPLMQYTNTAIGYKALRSATTGGYGVKIGKPNTENIVIENTPGLSGRLSTSEFSVDSCIMIGYLVGNRCTHCSNVILIGSDSVTMNVNHLDHMAYVSSSGVFNKCQLECISSFLPIDTWVKLDSGPKYDSLYAKVLECYGISNPKY